MEKMKILVIDDAKKHLDAAIQTLVGHDVTLCSSYDEALELLEERYDDEKRSSLIAKYREEGVKNSWSKACSETKLPYWDVVLCDLLMPAGRDAQGSKGKQFVGQEMPVGWSLALVAATRGAKYITVASDTNHHDHPASAMIDRIGVVNVDGAKVIFTNNISLVGIVGSECVCPTCNGTLRHNLRWDGKESDCTCKSGTSFSKWGKDWGKILNQLLRE